MARWRTRTHLRTDPCSPAGSYQRLHQERASSEVSPSPSDGVRNRRGIQGRNVEYDEDMWRHGPINQEVTRIDAVQSIAVLACRWCGYNVYRGAGVYPRCAAPPATSNCVLEN